jgi:uncharacterized protein (TIGR03437 family)
MKLSLLMALVLPTVHAQTYSFVTFDPPGSVLTRLTGINNQGQVVGTYNDASGVTHSFLRQPDGTFSTFDVPQAAAGQTVATAINNLGQIVGSYQDGAGKSHGFIRSTDGSSFITFDSPDPAIGFTPAAINDQGEVAGNIFVGAGHTYGFLRSADGSTYTRIIAPPNAFYTDVNAMNNSDEIVGFYQLGGSGSPKRGFVRTADGAWADWELPGFAEGTIPNWIDNHGRILSLGVVVNPDRTSFALDASAIAPAAAIPAVLNDNGLIAGATFVGGIYHAFIATPVSQPTGPTFWSAVLASAFYTFYLNPQDAFAPGEWIEIYGTGLSSTTRAWRVSDFTGSLAPTSLDGISVEVNGQPAYVSYVSPGQVNALVPSTLSPGAATIIVKNGSQASAAHTTALGSSQPGLLRIANAQGDLAVAVFPDFRTYAFPAGATTAVPTRPASPGDTIIFFGIGFGAVDPPVLDGQVVTGQHSLTGNLQVTIGGVQAQVLYAGLSPGSIGLYQFNVVVPDLRTSAAAVPVVFMLNGLYIPFLASRTLAIGYSESPAGSTPQ